MREHFQISNPYYCSVRDGSPGEVAKNTTNSRRFATVTANQINYWNLVEQQRANQERERETRRSNLAKESLTQQQNLISAKRAEAQNELDAARTVQTGVDTALSPFKSIGSLLGGLIK